MALIVLARNLEIENREPLHAPAKTAAIVSIPVRLLSALASEEQSDNQRSKKYILRSISELLAPMNVVS